MPKVSFRMASASRESVFGVQTNMARKIHRSNDAEGRLTTAPSGCCVRKGRTNEQRGRGGLVAGSVRQRSGCELQQDRDRGRFAWKAALCFPGSIRALIAIVKRQSARWSAVDADPGRFGHASSACVGLRRVEADAVLRRVAGRGRIRGAALWWRYPTGCVQIGVVCRRATGLGVALAAGGGVFGGR
jgi:hypothetical protein